MPKKKPVKVKNSTKLYFLGFGQMFTGRCAVAATSLKDAVKKFNIDNILARTTDGELILDRAVSPEWQEPVLNIYNMHKLNSLTSEDKKYVKQLQAGRLKEYKGNGRK